MLTVNRIPELRGVYFHGIALRTHVVSAYVADQQLAYLERQTAVARARSYYFPQLQLALYVLLVETPLSCDALSYVRGLTGLGTPFLTNQ